MSYFCCTTKFVVNENQSATATIELCDVCYKTIQACTSKPEEWINNIMKNSIQSRGDYICQRQIEKYLSEGTMPANVTKESLISAFEIDPSKPLY